MNPRLVAALEKAGIPLLPDEPLSRHTTLGVGGKVPLFLTPRTSGEAAHALALLAEHACPFRVLGAGSNVLAEDEGLDFAVVATRELTAVTFDGTRIEAEAGAFLPRLARAAAERGLAGLEFAIGVPGSIGGALRMNAGAWGSDMSRVVESVQVVAAGEAEEAPFTPRFSYRSSGVGADSVVTRVALRLTAGDRDALLATLEGHVAERKRTQPVAARSAGCAFRNPPGDRAGRLIDACGLKGLEHGAAQVSPLHANFLLNRGGARAADLLALLAEVKHQVAEKTGVTLGEEVVIWRRSDSRPIHPM